MTGVGAEGPGWCVPVDGRLTGGELAWDGEVAWLDGRRVPPGVWPWVGPDGAVVGVPLVVAAPAVPTPGEWVGWWAALEAAARATTSPAVAAVLWAQVVEVAWRAEQAATDAGDAAAARDWSTRGQLAGLERVAVLLGAGGEDLAPAVRAECAALLDGVIAHAGHAGQDQVAARARALRAVLDGEEQ